MHNKQNDKTYGQWDAIIKKILEIDEKDPKKYKSDNDWKALCKLCEDLGENLKARTEPNSVPHDFQHKQLNTLYTHASSTLKCNS